MELFSVQYADPEGTYPLADDAAWQLYSRNVTAAEALDDARDAGNRDPRPGVPSRMYTRYAVRVVDFRGDVVLTDLPDAVAEHDAAREDD